LLIVIVERVVACSAVRLCALTCTRRHFIVRDKLDLVA
jgi:hypothetical protein